MIVEAEGEVAYQAEMEIEHWLGQMLRTMLIPIVTAWGVLNKHAYQKARDFAPPSLSPAPCIRSRFPDTPYIHSTVLACFLVAPNIHAVAINLLDAICCPGRLT